jgi:hypothetical protein
VVSNGLGDEPIVYRTQFRIVLRVLQTALAVVFGGWGLWLRNSILSRPFLGSSDGWATSLSFHVWPWPFKFAAVVNMPAFLIGSFLAWPLNALRPGLQEWISTLPILLFIPLLWYWVGSWLDKRLSSENRGTGTRGLWFLLLLFIAICTTASSIPFSIGGYTNYLDFGALIWLTVVIGMVVSTAVRKYRSKIY